MGQYINLHDFLKKSEAWDIVAKKTVSIMRLRLSTSCEHYNKIYPTYRQLTNEEYDLLKNLVHKEDGGLK